MSARPLLAALICFLALLGSACRKPAPSTAPEKSPAAAVSTPLVLAQPALSPAASSAKRSEEQKTNKSIRDVDLQTFLKTRYREIQPDLDVLEEQCPEGQDHIRSIAPFQYADLDGDGQEEAVFEGFTCMAGTAGIDFFGVLKIMPDGELVELPFEKEGKEFKGRIPYEGLRGHLRLEIKDARLLKTFPVYEDEKECSSCADGGERILVYRWDGHHFVLDDIIEVPPQKSGT